jgi:hypothetical protein
MKRLLTASALLLSIALITSACSDLAEGLAEPTATAKVDTPSEPASSQSASQAVAEPAPSEEAPADIWTRYESTWEDDFGGLKTRIDRVGVTDTAPDEEKGTNDASYVGVRFYLENTTTELFTTYPDQATLVTSTGEQIDSPDFFNGDGDVGGEIDEGVIKEGTVMWKLQRGHALDIKWIKLKWRAYKGDSYSGGRDYEVKLNLQP